jgi:hypothetical protein
MARNCSAGGALIVLEREAGAGPSLSLARSGPLDKLREHFESYHWALAPGLMGPRMLDWVREEVERTAFDEREEAGLVSELTIDGSSSLVARLLFLFNDPALYRVVEEITGIPRLARYDGRIYRRLARPGHYNEWHDDLAGDARLVAMSINLGSEPYSGGVLALRHKGAATMLGEVHNSGPGDALLFRVRADLVHRVTTVTEGEKMASVGWFGAAPPWPLPVPPEGRWSHP